VDDKPLVLGWEEWLALPALGLPALKAKVDTGARTSALHAFDIEPFGPADRPEVRFGVHPVPGRNDLEVQCHSVIVDRREFTSSNGETEWRYVIETPVHFGDRHWPIEISLTNRQAMSYRMLLGRQSLAPDALVAAHQSFLQPALGYDLYRGRAAHRRPLRLALLTREPNNYSSRRLVEAAVQRGVTIATIDTARCSLMICVDEPALDFAGRPAADFDAAIPRIGASMTVHGVAVVRQFEALGRYSLNRAGAIASARDKLRAHQVLAQHRIAMPRTAIAYSARDARQLIEQVGGAPVVVKLLASTQGRGVVLAETRKAAESVIGAFRDIDAAILVQEFVAEAEGADIRCIVLGGKVIAAMQRQAAAGEFRSNLHLGGRAFKVKLTLEERKLAKRAALAIGLDLAGVDMLRTKTGPKVLEVNASPGLEGIEGVTGKDLAGMILDHVISKASARARLSDAS
jgi:ribosomal protein S6--L-glutamate ligase